MIQINLHATIVQRQKLYRVEKNTWPLPPLLLRQWAEDEADHVGGASFQGRVGFGYIRNYCLCILTLALHG
jgi:hypothetical protein